MLLCGLLIPVLRSVAQDPYFVLVERPHDDFEGNIVGMVQDVYGFLWLATEQGIYKYDGHQYTAYHHEPMSDNSPADFHIWCIAADRDGNIWFGPNGKGVDRLDPSTETFTHFRHDKNDPESLGNDAVTTLYQDREGTMWLGTDEGLDKLDTHTNKFTHYRHSPDDASTISCNAVRTIYEDRDGTLWIGTGSEYHPVDRPIEQSGGLNKFDKKTGKFTRYLHDDKNPNTLIDNRVRTIFEDSRGIFWVGTAGDGLHTFDRKTGLFKRHTYDAENPGKLSRPPVIEKYPFVSDHISFINEDVNGKIWIGTFEGSINVYDPSTGKCQKYDSKVNANAIGYWTALRTTDTTLWISSSESELYKVKPYKNLLHHVGLGSIVNCFSEDDHNTLWVGTSNGLVNIKTNKTILPDHNPDSPANLITSLVNEPDSMWVSTIGGLFRFDALGKMFRVYHHNDSNANRLVCDSITTLRKNNRDELWIGTLRGLDLLDTKKNLFTHFINDDKVPSSLSHNKVITIAVDRKHNVWVGTLFGLNKFDSITHSFKRYLNQLAIIKLMKDRQGKLWCGTDNGLFLYDEGTDTFKKFTDESGMITPQLVLGGLVNDYLGNFWMISPQKGIIRLDSGKHNATVYGKNRGVDKSTLTGAAYLTHAGNVLHGDQDGYFLIEPATLQSKIAQPQLSLAQLLVNDVLIQPSVDGILSSSLNDTKEINLNYHQNSITFKFNNIDFISEPDETRVLYTMTNYDNGWRSAADDRSALYFNLPPGDYIFKVRAINVFGGWKQRDIHVVIHAPWWKTWWAYAMFTVIMASIIYALYRNRINQLKEKQTEQMILMVATQEGERKRISRDLHDDVGTKLSALKLSLSSLGEKAAKINNVEIKALAQNSEQFITEVMQDVRQLLLNLSPAVLEEFGYTTAIESLINKLNETRTIHFNLVIFGWQVSIRKDYELALYRITQELINNVIRHADAKNVSLQVGQRDEKIILMIEDDGKGFDLATHKDGYGLHNLEARTKVMKGTMTIDSRPGKGTSVLIEIPYNLK